MVSNEVLPHSCNVNQKGLNILQFLFFLNSSKRKRVKNNQLYRIEYFNRPQHSVHLQWEVKVKCSDPTQSTRSNNYEFVLVVVAHTLVSTTPSVLESVNICLPVSVSFERHQHSYFLVLLPPHSHS